MGGTCSVLALVGPGHKVLRCGTLSTWAVWQMGEKGSMDYETDIIKSGGEKKAFKLLFWIDAAAEDFLAEAKLALLGCAS